MSVKDTIPLRNLTLQYLELDENTYIMDVAIRNNYFVEWDRYYFILSNRSTTESIEISDFRLKERKENFLIYQIEISLTEMKEFIEQGEIFDLSIVREFEEEERSARIKSNYNFLELYQYDMSDCIMFHPFTTRQGNISFNKREHYLFSRIDYVQIVDDGKLEINGLFYHPLILKEDIKKIELVIESNLKEEKVEVQLGQEIIHDQYRQEPWFNRLQNNGFSTVINLNPYFTLGKSNYFKFYLRLSYESNGELESVTSGRLKVDHRQERYPKKKKFKRSSSRIQVVARPTQKAKYLSIRMAEYKTLIEMGKGIKRSWIQIRRSKRILNVYKFIFNVLAKLLPTNKKLIMFESFHGKQYSDSPRAIYEYMLENNYEHRLIWSADRRHTQLFDELDVPYVRRFSLRWLFLMSTSRYWITNARLPLWIPKPRGTKYLQTWHGTPLKRLALDMEEVQMPGTNTERYKENFITETSKWDYLVSPNSYSTKIFKRAFEFNEQMIESGYPRNDYLYQHNNEKAINELKRKLDIPLNKQVILYAPTWRDNQFYRRGRYKFDIELDLQSLYEKFKDTHIIIFRMHYLVAENLNFSNYEGFAYDFSSYADIRDLYLLSDILITDYSSVFFDYGNLRRPMMFFVYDIDDYRDNLRGFYFDFEKKAPGPLVKTTAELITEIDNIYINGFQPSGEFLEFVDKFCYLEDGHASRRVVETVFK